MSSNTNNQDTGTPSQGAVTPDTDNNDSTSIERRKYRRGGQGGGYGGGRGWGRGDGQSGYDTASTRFKGSIPKMNGYVFTLNMDHNPKHEFNRTLKELQGYAAQECDSPNLFMPLFGKDPTSPSIISPSVANNTKQPLQYKFIHQQ